MSRESEGHWWPSEHEPLSTSEHAAQIAALPSVIGTPPRSVLDLGCGTGRVLVPLVGLGYQVTGLDRDEAALGACRAALDAAGVAASLVEIDITSTWPVPRGSVDAVLCLGNTFCTLHEVDVAW